MGNLREERRTYIGVAVDNFPPLLFLDCWWGFLAEKGVWVGQHGKLEDAPRLMDLASAYLYNIQQLVIRSSGDEPLGPGGCRLVGAIAKILEKRDREEDDLPF